MIPQWLSAQQAPLASAFYKRCGSKEKAKRDERVAVIRDQHNQVVACLRLATVDGHTLLRALLVDPSQRHQGLALKLLRYVVAESTQPIWCFPYPHLQPLYQQAGFKLADDAPDAIRKPYLAYCRKQSLLLMELVNRQSR